ncbi:hypothetical protein GG344DRAFT_42489, partial [Lentinula edodes]
IEETCRVFPMTLRVVGFSRAPVPTYDPLVYALPVIHVVGEFRGSDVNESVARRARGTVRMIGDRAIRWNLISSEVSTPERDEWVMEGVQVGDIGSAMGIVGMWTGANHERGDPIGLSKTLYIFMSTTDVCTGPSWAWKME